MYLKSGQGLQLNTDVKCYFRSFSHFREVIIRPFFTKLKDPRRLLASAARPWSVKPGLLVGDSRCSPTSSWWALVTPVTRDRMGAVGS